MGYCSFQEYFLSVRRIIFVNSQTYYVCRNCFWREDDAGRKKWNRNTGHDESYLSILNSFWMDDNSDTHEMWTMMLFHYTKRQLTYESDILNAVAGIGRALSVRCKCSFFQGMPVAALDLYLLFRVGVGPAERRRKFPSYSWAGWCSQIVFEDMSDPANKSDWLSSQTWIIWYKYEPSTGAVSLVWDINQNPGFLEADIGYRSRRSFQPKSAKTRLYCKTDITRPSGRQHIVDQIQYTYPLLQFWTVSVYFDVTFCKGQGTIGILDRNGDYCGCAYQNAVVTGIQINESEPIELIILSECWKSGLRGDRDVFHEIQEHMSRNSANEEYSKEFEDHSFFWALWIRWDGSVAERVGIAQIFQAAMEESLEPGPVWKEILLG